MFSSFLLRSSTLGVDISNRLIETLGDFDTKGKSTASLHHALSTIWRVSKDKRALSRIVLMIIGRSSEHDRNALSMISGNRL